MSERDRGPVNIPIDRPENENLDSNLVWQNLFVSLMDLSKVRNMPANSYAPSLDIKKSANDPDFEYCLRVNPAILTEEGNIEVVVIDLLHNGLPSQQLVIKAENWQNGKPQNVIIDPSELDENPAFEIDELALYANSITKLYIDTFAINKANSKMIIQTPPGYTNGLN